MVHWPGAVLLEEERGSEEERGRAHLAFKEQWRSILASPTTTETMCRILNRCSNLMWTVLMNPINARMMPGMLDRVLKASVIMGVKVTTGLHHSRLPNQLAISLPNACMPKICHPNKNMRWPPRPLLSPWKSPPETC
jgi:hypothetical protein